MSECELPQYYVCKERVARKVHKCCECDAPIEPREKYLQINAAWDGSPCVQRQHLLCEEACEYVRDKGLNNDDCLYFGELKEFYNDEYGPRGDAGETERRHLWRLMLRISRRERKAKLAK